jgi:hypothetical protein
LIPDISANFRLGEALWRLRHNTEETAISFGNANDPSVLRWQMVSAMVALAACP